MKNVLPVFILILAINFKAIGQIKYEDLFGGKWKYYNMPDSTRWPDSTLHLVPSNPSFWFKDSSRVDVVWNGFYCKDMKYIISKKTNLISIYVDTIYANEKGFGCVIKPISKGLMKLQYCVLKNGELEWNDNETWYNTDTIHLYNFWEK